jgi:uncharacterized protein
MSVPGQSGGSVRQFVLKVVSRCDLACDHCYVYESVDQSWRLQPRTMSDAVLDQVLSRIEEHRSAFGLPGVDIVLHGGEPLLLGHDRMRQVLTTIRARLGPSAAVSLQTNAVRLDRAFADLFREFGVRVGISFDGGPEATARHRRFADGRSSYPQVRRAVELLAEPRYRGIFGGLLCTVEVLNPALEVYEHLASFAPPRIDLLLPHATWDSPPPAARAGTTPYADWLIPVFDHWYEQADPVPVRLFEELLVALLGGVSRSEAIGLSAPASVVVETDGTLEQTDALKITYPGAAATGLSVHRNAFAVLAEAVLPSFANELSSTCRSCPVLAGCGGGLFPHRFRSENGFDNPSVYCADLEKLVRHVSTRIQEETKRIHVKETTVAADPPKRSISRVHFDELAAGFGSAAAVRGLGAGQVDRRKLLVAGVLEQLQEVAAEGAADLVREGCALLDRVGASRPELVGGPRGVLLTPFLEVWAVDLIRRAADGGPPGELALRSSYLLAGAVQAASLAGLSADYEVPLPVGGLTVPGAGRFDPVPENSGILRASDRGVELLVGGQRAGFRASPQADLAGLTLTVDDDDPYRDVFEHALLPAQELDYAGPFAAAWKVICEHHPEYAEGIGAGLRSVVPLRSAGHEDVSAASRQAFGAVSCALPSDPEMLALLLIHEFQHVKLGALIDLVPMVDPEDRTLVYAPWRQQMRPLGPLLQGIYAHLGVTDFWRDYRWRQPAAEAADAHRKFAEWRTWTMVALEDLAAAPGLTGAGREFVAGVLAAAQSRWAGEKVPQVDLAAAENAVRRQRRAVELTA